MEEEEQWPKIFWTSPKKIIRATNQNGPGILCFLADSISPIVFNLDDIGKPGMGAKFLPFCINKSSGVGRSESMWTGIFTAVCLSKFLRQVMISVIFLWEKDTNMVSIFLGRN